MLEYSILHPRFMIIRVCSGEKHLKVSHHVHTMPKVKDHLIIILEKKTVTLCKKESILAKIMKRRLSGDNIIYNKF